MYKERHRGRGRRGHDGIETLSDRHDGRASRRRKARRKRRVFPVVAAICVILASATFAAWRIYDATHEVKVIAKPAFSESKKSDKKKPSVAKVSKAVVDTSDKDKGNDATNASVNDMPIPDVPATDASPVVVDMTSADAVDPAIDMVEFDGQVIDTSTMPVTEHRPSSEIGATGFMYASLNPKEKQAYADCLYQFRARQRMFVIDYVVDYAANEDLARIYYVIDSVLSEHPELFWIIPNGDGMPEVFSVRGTHLFVGTRWNVPGEDIDTLRSQIDEWVADYMSYVEGKATEYDKTYATYEYLILICNYEHGGIDDPLNQSMASVFLNGTSVCAGYAQAMAFLLDHVGVRCWYVPVGCRPDIVYSEENVGLDANGLIPHAFDVVCIDGQWRYWDPTFGDTYDLDVPSGDYTNMDAARLEAEGYILDYPNVFPTGS